MKNHILTPVICAFMAATLVASSAWAAPREVRIASHVSALSPLHQQSQMFANEVEKRLPGQFDFKIFPGGQLGKEKALITNVRAGSLEMINVASGVMKLDKKLGVFDLPWLFDDRKHVRCAMQGGLEDAMRKRIEDVTDVKVIGIYENGFRHVVNAKQSIRTPDDMRGLKIRVSGGKFRQGVFRQIGASPQSVPWQETFTALQTGVVDGAEAAIYGFYEQKHHEAAPYLSLTRHVYTPSFLVMSRNFWNELNDEQQRVFEEAGRSITDKAYEEAEKLEKRYLAEMRNNLEVNETDQPAFRKATAESYNDYIESQGRDWLDMAQAANCG